MNNVGNIKLSILTFPVIVGILIFSGAIVLYYELTAYQDQINEDHKEKLEKSIENVISRRESRVQTVASSIIAFYSSSHEVEPSEFDNFSSIILGSNIDILNLFVLENNKITKSYPNKEYLDHDFDKLFPTYPTEIAGTKSMTIEFPINQELYLIVAIPFDYFIPSGTIVSDQYKLILLSPIDNNTRLYEIEKEGENVKNSVNLSDDELAKSLKIVKQTKLFGHKIKKYYDLKYILWDDSFVEQFSIPTILLISGFMLSFFIPILLIRTNILRKKLQEKSENLQQVNEELIKVEKSKGEFATMIVHDLKTPLVPIRSYADMLLSQQFGTLNEKQIQRISTIKSSADLLLKMIQDLLDVNMVELNQLKLSVNKCSLDDIITDTTTKLKHDLEKHNIMVTTDLQHNVVCFCDMNRIDQVLTNLIINAIDFCPKENGKIHIILKSDTNDAKITVEDNGVGISKDKLDKVFVKFYQIDTSTKREYGGTGLGLAICKGIIESHGGKIWAESDLGKGTKMHVTLPLK